MGTDALPAAWHKYQGFIKKCALRKCRDSKTVISLVSVWAHDYLDSKRSNMWENFPDTIFIDEQFKQVGTIPEVYPMGTVTEQFVYYGKWQGDIPREILIDVSNPAVSGDYYYEPLIWDEKTWKYEMKDRQDKSGPRPAMHRKKKSNP